MNELAVVMVGVGELVGSPLNRRFETCGVEWEEFCASVKRDGVQVPLVARKMTGEDGVGFGEILAGHRRHAAAVACGLKQVPVMWLALDDAAALAFLVNENLQRLNLSPVDEARLVRAMREELAITDEEIGRRICRGVAWVRTRQLLLDLGDEVREAVRSRDEDRHLTLASVEEILRVPEEWREEAVQLVLHPSFQLAPLLPGQAREVLQEVIVKPRAAAAAWSAGCGVVVAEWKKRLKGSVPKELVENVACVAVAYEDRERMRRGMEDAETLLPVGMLTPEAPHRLTWGGLAARHGLAVQVVPKEDGAESVAVVCCGLLRLAEETLAEHGGKGWLCGKALSSKHEARNEEEEKIAGRIAGAVRELDGEGGDEVEDRPEVEITQGMEHYGMIDLGAVKKVAMWAVMPDANPMDAPAWVPKWACRMGMEGMWTEVDEVVNWVMGLKKS